MLISDDNYFIGIHCNKIEISKYNMSRAVDINIGNAASDLIWYNQLKLMISYKFIITLVTFIFSDQWNGLWKETPYCLYAPPSVRT